jgi:hypothetical protein
MAIFKSKLLDLLVYQRVAIDWGLKPCRFRPKKGWRLKPTSLLDREDGLECSSTSVTMMDVTVQWEKFQFPPCNGLVLLGKS